jgi:head-tail adaptor
MEFRPGQLRHKIEIHEPTDTRADSGQVITSYSLANTTRGHLIPGGGSEGNENEQITSVNRAAWIIRNTTITPRYRIIFGSDVYRIIAVERFFPKHAPQAPRYLKIHCELKDSAK